MYRFSLLASFLIIAGVLFAPAGYISAQDITTGLAGHWKFDETSGTIASDSSGNNLTGTLVNGPTWTTGILGNALFFDGADDRVTLGDPAALKITGPLTISSWVRRNSSDVYGFIFTRDGGSTDFGYRLFIDNANHPSFAVAYNATSDANTNSTTVLAPNQWYHITGVYEPGVSIRLYVNGALNFTKTAIPGSIRLSTKAPLIGRFGAGWGTCNCVLDDVRVYNRALTASEIQLLANPSSPDTTPPSTPTLNVPAAISSSQINLSWSAASDLQSAITSYKLYYCSGSSSCTPSTLLTLGNVTNYSHTSLAANTLYRYQVSAVSSGGEGARSAIQSATTQVIPTSIEPVWPGTNTRYYPGIYPRASSGDIAGIGNTLNQWWGNVDRTKYREYQNGQRATHIGIKVNLNADDFFSSYWHNSISAPYNYAANCNNSTLMQNPDAVVNGQRVYDWDLIDSVLALPLIANGEAKVIFWYDDQDMGFTKGKWWDGQGMMDNSGAQPKKYDWVYVRLKMDFLKAWATRYRNNPKIAALHFEEFAGLQDSGPTCGYVVTGQSWQVSAENGTFFYPAMAVLEADPGLMVFKVGPAVYTSQYFDGPGAALGLNDLPGAQGIAIPDARFFTQGCGSGLPGTVDCQGGDFHGYWLGQQALVRNDLPVMTHAERNGWRNLYDGSPPNTRRINAQNPWGVSQWPGTDGDWDGENIGGVRDSSSHDYYAFPDPMFWVWYFSGPSRAVDAAADSGLGQAGPDPAGVIPSVMYEPIVPWCAEWGCANPTDPQKITNGWNATNMSINRFLKAFEVFGPSGTKAMFAHPSGYPESFASNSDTQTPAVSLTAPASGSTVSGTFVTVSANASDPVVADQTTSGIAGVQFLLNGANLNSEDTTSPYSITWNTTTVTNGSHTLTARARDAAGNTTTSIGVMVTVNNPVISTASSLTLIPSLEGRSSPLPSGIAFTVSFLTPGTNTIITSMSLTTNASGQLVPTASQLASLPRGTYDIRTASSNYLSKKMFNQVLTSNNTITAPTLYAGDFNNDGVVNNFDWSIMASNWFTSFVTTDINKDGITNSVDYSFVNRNWNRMGE